MKGGSKSRPETFSMGKCREDGMGTCDRSGKADFHGVFDKGDLGRILLAFAVMAALAFGEVGVFWVTIDKPKDGLLQPSGEGWEKALQGRFGRSEGELAVRLEENRQRHYLQPQLGWSPRNSLAPTMTRHSGGVAEPPDSSDLRAPGAVLSEAEESFGICP